MRGRRGRSSRSHLARSPGPNWAPTEQGPRFPPGGHGVCVGHTLFPNIPNEGQRAPGTQTSPATAPRAAGKPCLPLQSSRAPPPAAMRPAGLLLALLFFLSRVLAARGRFKEICAHPNGSCQEFCLETEIQAGRCLNGHACCRPMVFESIIEPTTPKE
ncbi:beta-defensin 108B [Canis lupus baileyi]|uniref:Beta-defensin 108B n=3 Tax=Canis lupus TaxID=9612 RepID=A0A8P0TEY5_CANLF|nr:uncharacterized protein CBD108 isoform X1 [Canis lupus familiaris]XP_038546263.1 uncharacterized protein CBD108 isoform X1 [Canis lupus familiaris]|eukprot:XP_003432171.2 uncharacterized protein CBD108 [Canis lupus familiaris]